MKGVMIILYHKIMVYSPRVVESYVFENDTSTLKQIKITKNIQEKPKKENLSLQSQFELHEPLPSQEMK